MSGALSLALMALMDCTGLPRAFQLSHFLAVATPSCMEKDSTTSAYALRTLHKRCRPCCPTRPAASTVDRGLFGKAVLVDARQPHDETVK